MVKNVLPNTPLTRTCADIELYKFKTKIDNAGLLMKTFFM